MKIAEMSLFTKQNIQLMNNTEGAVLFQLIFQFFQGTECLNAYFEKLMDRILERLREKPMKNFLLRQILLVFLSAIIYNTDAALKWMEMRSIIQDIFP
jgi:hypothetical protein